MWFPQWSGIRSPYFSTQLCPLRARNILRVNAVAKCCTSRPGIWWHLINTHGKHSVSKLIKQIFGNDNQQVENMTILRKLRYRRSYESSMLN